MSPLNSECCDSPTDAEAQDANGASAEKQDDPEASSTQKEEEDEEEEDLDVYCLRCRREWGYPGWFSLREGQHTIDLPASFAPTDWRSRLVKLCLAVWFDATLIYKWWRSRENAAFFMAYLTHINLILCSLWMTVSCFNSFFPPQQPTSAKPSVGPWIKFSWLLFTQACHSSLATVVLYWTLDYNPGETELGYMDLFVHGCVIMVWPEGLAVNRIPVRWKHLLVPMLCGVGYGAWLAVHQLATDIGDPTSTSDNDPDTNDDLLYEAFDFENSTASSVGVVLFNVLVLTPWIHWVLWSVSLYNGCSCSGRNRRYVPGSDAVVGEAHTADSVTFEA